MPNKKRRKRPSGTIERHPWKNWLRMREVPFSPNTTYKLIENGYLVSAVVTLPGSKRGIRMVLAESLDRYLHSLARIQQSK